MKRWFITGTDTGVGKTYAACAFVRHLVNTGYEVAAMKPVASGCEMTADGLRNEDAVALMGAINVPMDYGQLNPYAFEPAIAPHIAAARAGRTVEIETISSIADRITADHLVIEGAGGWCVPLNEQQLFPDLVRALAADVVLVVGMRLGCINHAILSARQIEQDGLRLAGWIANAIDPEMPVYRENLELIEDFMPVPLLAEIPPGGDERCFNHEILARI